MNAKIIYNTGKQEFPHSSIRLTLKNGKVIPFNDDEESLNTKNMLKSLFYGETAARENLPEDYDDFIEADYIALPEELHTDEEEYYIKVVKAEWSFASTAPFGQRNRLKDIVEHWMNKTGIDNVFNHLQHGITKYGPPSFTNNPTAIFKEYLSEVEEIISEICTDMGTEFWYIYKDPNSYQFNIDFSKLAVIAFEETVKREAIHNLNIEW